jgi:hypothetical protein
MNLRSFALAAKTADAMSTSRKHTPIIFFMVKPLTKLNTLGDCS